jgi:hypothetical protein
VATIDEIAPPEIRAKRIALTLDPSVSVVRAFEPIVVNVDYAKTLPDDVMLPLILEVQGPSTESYQRREFIRVKPGSFVVRPREGGVHMVTLREAAHNRFWGSLRLDVQGEQLVPKPAF